MIRVQLDAASVSRVRVAVSPVLEAVFWLGLTVSGRRHPVFGDPGPAARSALRDRDVAVAALLASGLTVDRYVPDFLTPAPGLVDPDRVLQDQLERIRDTEPAQAHDQLLGPRRGVPALERAGHAGDRLPAVAASGLEKFWRIVLDDGWSGLADTARGSVSRHGELVARRGLGTSLGALHPGLRWRGDSFWMQHGNPGVCTIHLEDQDLVLVPSLLTVPHLSAQLESTSGAFICFPVSSPAQPSPARYQGGSRLLGRGRSEVLDALHEPSTTRALSRRIGLGEPTVSHHLHVLLEAGLVDRRRQGREVTYALTSSGRILLDAVRDAGR